MSQSKPQRMTSAQVRDWFTGWCDSNGYVLASEFSWVNSRTRYAATCPKGHTCTLLPYAVKGRGDGCEQCSYVNRGLRRKDSQAARARFLDWAAAQGFQLVDFQWKGAMRPHAAVCPRGHACQPRPNDVLNQGKGGCVACRGAAWDAFYVVHHAEAGHLKFGITSGNPKPRLADHRRDGFTAVLRVFMGLPDGEALRLEQELMRLLKLAGVQPVQGREYFPDATLDVVLAVADDWLS